jgi:hypothetical protein
MRTPMDKSTVARQATAESLLKEMAELIEYHERMVSHAKSLDDLLDFLLPPKFEVWLTRYRECQTAGFDGSSL